MYDVTKDVIDYFKNETRDEDEFQKIWAELAQWKTDRDAEMKKQTEEEQKRKAATIRKQKLDSLRDKAAAAQAQYMVELFAETSQPCSFDEIYNANIEKYKRAESAVEFVDSLDKMFQSSSPTKAAAEKTKDTCKCANKSKSDEEKLEEFLRKAGLLN